MAANQTELSDEQLVQQILDRERQLVAARFTHSMNQLENTASLRVIRKDIARLKTTVRSREIAKGLPQGALLTGVKVTAPKPTPETTAQVAAPEKGGFLKGIVDKLTGNQ